MAEYKFIINKFHIFLIQSSLVVHFGCFHTLGLVNNAVINMAVQVLCCNLTYIPLVISLGVELLDHKDVLFLAF
jgi:hypothetical protein